jgi:hypothetical protein
MALESRRIATLLLTMPDAATWKKAIEIENILQKESISTAVRQSVLIRKRLETLDATAWKLVADRESEITIQLLFAASIKYHQILADFMCNVYLSAQRKLEPAVTQLSWEDFLIECSHHDRSVADWNENTKLKIFNAIARILIEAKYLVDRKTMMISPRSLHPVVRRYLQERSENFVLNCLERS